MIEFADQYAIEAVRRVLDQLDDRLATCLGRDEAIQSAVMRAFVEGIRHTVAVMATTPQTIDIDGHTHTATVRVEMHEPDPHGWDIWQRQYGDDD